MSNQHNPIAQLVSQLQQKWNSEVVPHDHINLVRWLILPEQARLYEGFLRLESTDQGSLPDMVLVMLTPFESSKSHSKSIITDWIEIFRKEHELIEKVSLEHPSFVWDDKSFEARLSNDADRNNVLLIDMLRSFQEVLPEKGRFLTLGLFPYSVASPKDYAKWMDTLIRLGMPEFTRLMMFDFENERHFDLLLKSNIETGKTLSVPLDLQGAMSKIAQSGDPNNPEVQFRKCMLEMSKSTQKKDVNRLKIWGEKGLEATQRSGLKSMFASAHLAYAGMLFNFKEFDLIDQLLQKGTTLAKQGLDAGDDLCKPILIQSYGFQASSKQLQKKKEDAVTLFCQQADTALEHGFPQQPLMAWWMAYNVIKKKDKDQYKEIVSKAYGYGSEQEKELLKSSCMPFIAADFYNINEDDRAQEKCREIDAFMIELEGENWRDDLELRRKEMEKKRLSLKHLF